MANNFKNQGAALVVSPGAIVYTAPSADALDTARAELTPAKQSGAYNIADAKAALTAPTAAFTDEDLDADISQQTPILSAETEEELYTPRTPNGR